MNVFQTLKNHKYLYVLLMVLLTAGLLFTGCGADDGSYDSGYENGYQAGYADGYEDGNDEGYDDQDYDYETDDSSQTDLDEDGYYTSPQDVADYLYLYGELPDNFITKNEARDLGWDSQDGNLDEVAPGMSIGGDKFGNREGLLPKANGRQYYECDVNYSGGYRGGERIVYSNDGLIFYTDDHYNSFEQLY